MTQPIVQRAAQVTAVFSALFLVSTDLASAQGEPYHASIIPGWRQSDGTHVSAIEIRLSDGWHTYWRAPGEAGIPPQFDWSASRNLRAVSYEWPLPEVLETLGIRSIGYTGRLVLPVRLEPIDATQPVVAKADLHFGVCETICMAVDARVEAELPPSGQAHGRLDIESALAKRAIGPGEAGIASVNCDLSVDADGHSVTAEIDFDHAVGEPQTAVVEMGASDLWVRLPENRMAGNRLVAETRIGGGGVIDRSEMRVSVIDTNRIVDIQGCPAEPS